MVVQRTGCARATRGQSRHVRAARGRQSLIGSGSAARPPWAAGSGCRPRGPRGPAAPPGTTKERGELGPRGRCEKMEVGASSARARRAPVARRARRNGSASGATLRSPRSRCRCSRRAAPIPGADTMRVSRRARVPLLAIALGSSRRAACPRGARAAAALAGEQMRQPGAERAAQLAQARAQPAAAARLHLERPRVGSFDNANSVDGGRTV